MLPSTDFYCSRGIQVCSSLGIPMTIGKGKRPRDTNELAKWMVDQSTGDLPEPNEGGLWRSFFRAWI